MPMPFSSNVDRIGFGSMQLTGPGHWGPPSDPEGAVRLLREVVNAGVTHIDTADAYGPHTVEECIRKALHPYPDDLVIATKGGMTRQGPNQWAPCGQPHYLRQCVEMSLSRLRAERISLYYLHRIDPKVALEDQLGVLTDMQAEGKIHHIGVSKVSLEQLRTASKLVTIAAVQNRCNLADWASDQVLAHCEATGITFVAYAPLAAGALTTPGLLDQIAEDYGVTPAKLALAWLLHRSPATLPIPGTARSAHFHENLAACQIKLTPESMTAIELAAQAMTREERRDQPPEEVPEDALF
jgi:aryl-alcohol dehydrogenase-like predicted oxidoreductase